MGDLGIDGIDDELTVAIDDAEQRIGSSLEDRLRQVTMDDLRRSVALAQGVLDEDLMRGAWG